MRQARQYCVGTHRDNQDFLFVYASYFPRQLTDMYSFESISLDDVEAHFPWASCELTTYGNSYDELLTNASVVLVDQDGGEKWPTPYEDCLSIIQVAVEKTVLALMEKQFYDDMERHLNGK